MGHSSQPAMIIITALLSECRAALRASNLGLMVRREIRSLSGWKLVSGGVGWLPKILGASSGILSGWGCS
jgi:hypothetical protein